MKKIALGILGFALSTSLFAQDSENYSLQRERLVQKYKNTKPLVISFYNSKNSMLEINFTTNKYLPLANYLSEKLDRLVIFDVDVDHKNLNNEVLSNSEVVISSPLVLDTMLKNGWKPILVRNSPVSPSYIVRKADGINSISGLKNKKLISQKDSLASSYGLYALLTPEIYQDLTDAKKYYTEESNVEQQSSLKLLEDKKIDGIVLKDKDAKKLVAGSDKYFILKSGFTGPDSIIYVNPKVSDIVKLKNVLQTMTDDNLQAKEALVSAREFTPGEKNQFIEYTQKDNEVILKVIKSLE